MGPKYDSNIITQTVNDFYVKVTMVLSHFLHAHSYTDMKINMEYIFYPLHSFVEQHIRTYLVIVYDLFSGISVIIDE